MTSRYREKAIPSLVAVLCARPALPFCFYTRWLMHDFHTTRWFQVNPSAQVKRTRLGRSSIDKPTVEMLSVNRYGGNKKREALVAAFRTYRSVSQSEATLNAGREALSAVEFEDFSLEDDEASEVAVDFACLYLNACLLFSVHPTPDTMQQLLAGLTPRLESPLHWECLLSVLIALMRPTMASAGTNAVAFVGLLRLSFGEETLQNFSADGILLLLIATTRALAALHCIQVEEDEMAYLAQIQQMALKALVATPCSATRLRERMIVGADALCWRLAVGAHHTSEGELWLPDIMQHLHGTGNECLLEELSVSQCTSVLCASCLAFAPHPPTYSSGAIAEGVAHSPQYQRVLDCVVRHLSQRVRVHSLGDTVCALAGILINTEARLRYRKYPLALLESCRDQIREEISSPGSLNTEGDADAQALADMLVQLGSSFDDDLANVALSVSRELQAIQGSMGEK
ncbi:hypothetical protein ERJ75_000034900 [Trypanosoma vivax]|uniref:Uncharacterized protein n=1 Tax=Trypanosoma vivax (strain Y486) TaxID=1055687 RepID=G0U7T1_TRYVY|nr:hypothetical protein ERJ75_000034900 [Trypanosoma vivax]CCC51939.1 conserved hypothetical protein [Trypanosoma vivax Y486]